jgi:hypothetical protein
VLAKPQVGVAMKLQVQQAMQALGGLLLLAAVVVGVSGTLYRLLEPDGWLATLWRDGHLGEFTVFAVLLALAAFSAVAPEQQQSWRRNVFLYASATAGAYYLAHLFLSGHL